MTYPDPKVERLIEQHFIPVQFNVVEQPAVMDQFNAPWTPTIIIQDPEGREHRRSAGYLDPARFLGEVSLGWLKDAIDRRDFKEAQARVSEVLSLTKDDPAREPEALYWAAVAGFKASGDSQQLLQGWNALLRDFPQSEWARRAEFIRQ